MGSLHALDGGLVAGDLLRAHHGLRRELDDQVHHEGAPGLRAVRQLGIDCSLQSLAYVAINLATLAYITYSASSSGMLPTASGDWLALIPSQRVQEVSRDTLL